MTRKVNKQTFEYWSEMVSAATAPIPTHALYLLIRFAEFLFALDSVGYSLASLTR